MKMRTDIIPPWNPSLILDIALETHDLPDLLVKYEIDEVLLDRYYQNPQFTRELLHARAELAQSGSAFRAHARALAEVHLITMNKLMEDPLTPVATKVGIWQALVRYASLEPPKEAAPTATSGNITINIAGYAAVPPAIDITPSPSVAIGR